MIGMTSKRDTLSVERGFEKNLSRVDVAKL
jgi:hypothetical protein